MSILSLGLPTWYDQSVIILNQVVGSAQNMVDPSIPAPGSYDSNNVLVPLPLFASMMMYFNQALLGCGTILFAIMVFVGTINTAAEGQFLGKDWHSIWTPVRLIFGLLFIVPLQSGLCIGQKIILYAVLIGVNMGTTVWQQTINQIFNNSAQPPIPTYLNNTVTQMVEQVFMMQAVEAIVNNMPSPPTSGQISIPINQYFSIQGSLSSSQYPVLPSYISTAMANQISGLCGQLYSGDQSDCAGQLNSVLSGAQSLNSSVVGNGINYFFFIGSNLTGATSPISGNDLQGYPLPNFWKSQGDILVQGSYNYTFPPAPGTNINISGIATPPACPAKKGDIAGDTYCQVQSLISTYVAPASSKGENNPAPPPDCPKNPSPGQASCSMQAAVTAILDDAQLNVAISQFETALNTQNNNNNSNNSNPNNNVPTAPAYHDKDSENDTGTAQPSQ
ncbi:MAG: type secretion protein DotA, partial [Gammaproteobacteria bacterium]|nr:type secretion protein DotA [Gammaproteobacteria bacterium]